MEKTPRRRHLCCTLSASNSSVKEKVPLSMHPLSMHPCNLVKAAKSKQTPRLDLDDIIVASLEAFAAKRK